MASFVVEHDRNSRAGDPRAAALSAEPGEWRDDPQWSQVIADSDAGWEHLREHHGELLARYPNERIALHRDRVVFHSPDWDEFDRLLEEHLVRTGIHPSSLTMPYMDPDPPLLAL